MSKHKSSNGFYCHLPQSCSTVPADAACLSTLHVGHGKCILSLRTKKYWVIELGINPHIPSSAWNFKLTPKNKIWSVSQVSCWFPFPWVQMSLMQVWSQSVAVQGQQSVLVPILPPTTATAPREAMAQHQRRVPGMWHTRVWGLHFTGVKALQKSCLGGAAVRGKKKVQPQTKSLSSNLKSNEKHCRRIHG